MVGGAVGFVSGGRVRVKTPPPALSIAKETEDAARLRATELANTANVPVDPTDGASLQKGYAAQQAARQQIEAGQSVQVAADDADPARIEQIKEESAQRLQEVYKKEGAILQNRDRSSSASITQMQAIAANTDYGRLGFSRTFGSGAPVVAHAADIPEVQRGRQDFVDAEGEHFPVQYAVVEAEQVLPSNNVDGSINPTYATGEQITAIAGNGRTAGLQAAYRQGTAEKYRSALAADQLPGIKPEVIASLRQPMLVRIMRDEDIRPNMGDITNRADGAELSATELAMTDAQRVDLARLDFTPEGKITDDSVRQFAALMPSNERAGLIDKHGVPTQKAKDRLTNAIFQAAYDNTSLTDLLNTTKPTGISRLLSAYEQLAPKMVALRDAGELDFRPAMAEVLSEIHAARSAKQKLSLADLAAQQSTLRSPMANAFLQFIAKNDDTGGGTKGLTQGFGDLAAFARHNADMYAQGDTMFGPAIKPTQLDLMREFSRLTGVPIKEGDFVPVHKLQDVIVKKQVETAQKTVQSVQQEIAQKEISDASILEQAKAKLQQALEKIRDWIETEKASGKTPKGSQAIGYMSVSNHLKQLAKTNGVNLDSFTEHVIDSSAFRHALKRHGVGSERHRDQIPITEKDFLFIPEIINHPDTVGFGGTTNRGLPAITYTKRADNGIFYTIEEVRQGKGQLALTTLWKKKENTSDKGGGGYLKTTDGADVSGGTSAPSTITAEPTSGHLQAPIMGQRLAEVKDIRRNQEVAAAAKEAAINQAAINNLKADPVADQIHREAMTALEADPNMRIQLDESDSSISAAEFMARENERAQQLEQNADKGVPQAAACALLNGGLNVR